MMKRKHKRRLKALLDSLGVGLFSRRLYKLYLRAKFRFINRVEMQVGPVTLHFSTEDPFSKRWFSRYDGSKLHEEQVTRLLIQELAEARCFVDVGANLGWYTCLAGRLLPGGMVYSFEMDDGNYALLMKNVALNELDQVQCLQMAVDKKTGQTSYSKDDDTRRAGFMIAAGGREADSESLVAVQSVTLDDFFADKTRLPDVIKIDVEGAEGNVLKGMTRLMSQGRPQTIFVEIHPQKLPAFEVSTRDVFAHLTNHNYELFHIRELRKSDSSQVLERVHKPEELVDNTMLVGRLKQ